MSESLKPIRINSATFEIRNVGRSPAWIKEIRFPMRCVTQLEPIPNYETSSIETAEEFILFQEVIAGGGGEKQFAILEEALSESDIQTRYEDGSKFIGLYGVIKYEVFWVHRTRPAFVGRTLLPAISVPLASETRRGDL